MSKLQGVVNMPMCDDDSRNIGKRSPLGLQGILDSARSISQKTTVDQGNFILIENRMRVNQFPADLNNVFQSAFLRLLRTMATTTLASAKIHIAMEKESPILA